MSRGKKAAGARLVDMSGCRSGSRGGRGDPARRWGRFRPFRSKPASPANPGEDSGGSMEYGPPRATRSASEAAARRTDPWAPMCAGLLAGAAMLAWAFGAVSFGG